MNKSPAKHAAPLFGGRNASTILRRGAQPGLISPAGAPPPGMINDMPDILAAGGNPWVGTVQLGLCLLATVGAIWAFFWGMSR